MTIASPAPTTRSSRRSAASPGGAAGSAGPLRRGGEDLLAAADAAGWPARSASRGGQRAARGVGGRARRAREGRPGLGYARARRLRGAVGSAGRARSASRWGVADPGNVGAVLRAALAFGARAVALGPGCADPYGPKAVRASMGAIFAVPLARVRAGDLPGRAGRPHPGGGAAAGRARRPATRRSSSAPSATAFPADVAAACDRAAHIPIATESLNAAMAATVALYELSNRMARP